MLLSKLDNFLEKCLFYFLRCEYMVENVFLKYLVLSSCRVMILMFYLEFQFQVWEVIVYVRGDCGVLGILKDGREDIGIIIVFLSFQEIVDFKVLVLIFFFIMKILWKF